MTTKPIKPSLLPKKLSKRAKLYAIRLILEAFKLTGDEDAIEKFSSLVTSAVAVIACGATPEEVVAAVNFQPGKTDLLLLLELLKHADLGLETGGVWLSQLVDRYKQL
jgi:hypothetical protein